MRRLGVTVLLLLAWMCLHLSQAQVQTTPAKLGQVLNVTSHVPPDRPSGTASIAEKKGPIESTSSLPHVQTQQNSSPKSEPVSADVEKPATKSNAKADESSSSKSSKPTSEASSASTVSSTTTQPLRISTKQTPAKVTEGKQGAKTRASKPTASKPSVSKPVASKPAGSKPAASEPAASKPAASKLVQAKPTPPKPVAPKVSAPKGEASKPAPPSKPTLSKPVGASPQKDAEAAHTKAVPKGEKDSAVVAPSQASSPTPTPIPGLQATTDTNLQQPSSVESRLRQHFGIDTSKTTGPNEKAGQVALPDVPGLTVSAGAPPSSASATPAFISKSESAQGPAVGSTNESPVPPATPKAKSDDPVAHLLHLKERATMELPVKEGSKLTNETATRRSRRRSRRGEKDKRERERAQRNEEREKHRSSRRSRRRSQDKDAVKPHSPSSSASAAVATLNKTAQAESDASAAAVPPTLSPVVQPQPSSDPKRKSKSGSDHRGKAKRTFSTSAKPGSSGGRMRTLAQHPHIPPRGPALGFVRIAMYSFITFILLLLSLPRLLNKLRHLMAGTNNSSSPNAQGYARFESSALAATTASLPPPPPAILFGSFSQFIASLIAHLAYILPPSLSASLLRTALPHLVQSNAPIYRMLLSTGSVFGTAAEAAAVAFHASGAYGGSAWHRDNLKRGAFASTLSKGTINTGRVGPFGAVDAEIADEISDLESGGMTDVEGQQKAVGRGLADAVELTDVTRKPLSLGVSTSPALSNGTTSSHSMPHRIPVIHGLVAEAAAYASRQLHAPPVALTPAAAAIVAATTENGSQGSANDALLPPPPSSPDGANHTSGLGEDSIPAIPTSTLLAPAGVPLLTRLQLASIVSKLPPVYAASDMRLLYSLDVDGAGLATFYQKVADWSPLLLIVKDSQGYLMGAFCSDTWRPRSSYFGGKRTFVFTLYPKFKAYFSTEKNVFYQLATRSFIAVGGGDNHALWLDENFKSGSSGPSQTFGSPRLSGEASFRITNLQAYGFIPPQQ